MSNAEQLLEQVGVSDRRISAQMADEMRRDRDYYAALLKRDLRRLYRREGKPIHSGELRAAIDAARVHWTDEEIANSLGVGWPRLKECMWGRDPETGERTEEADCALFGGARVALRSLARGEWMIAPRPQDQYDVEPEAEPTKPTIPNAPKATRRGKSRARDEMTMADLTDEEMAVVRAIRTATGSLRPMTLAQLAKALAVPENSFRRPYTLAKHGAEILSRLRAWMATPAGVEALEAARLSTDGRKNRKSAVKEKV